MNRSQARRYLPLPEYDLTDPSEVRLTIWGSVVDEAYTQMLMSHTNLPFEEVMALDRVQKGRPIAVFHTFVDERLRRDVRHELVRRGIPSIDLLGPAVTGLSTLTGEEPSNKIGALRDRLISVGE